MRQARSLIPAFIGLAAAAATAGASQPGFQGLGFLPGGVETDSRAEGVSADGSVVVGTSSSASGTHQAFRWTQAGGIVGLGDLPGGVFYSQANGVNADGSVVVGRGVSASGGEAFRWTQAGGIVGLGDLPGGEFASEANGVSADGSVVVGEGLSASGFEAFRWTQAGGMVGLGDLAGGLFSSIAYGVSADGSVVVGEGASASGSEAFRWTQAGGMVGLGNLSGGPFSSIAHGVSADGSVVVGGSDIAGGSEAFRWTQAGGMVGLGDLPGGPFSSEAGGVSGDGRVVVGSGTSASGAEAFRWTQATGMQSVTDWLADSGVTVTGWKLTAANAVNADGSVVVGQGTNPGGNGEAWLARASSGLIGLDDLAASLGSGGAVTAAGESLATLPLHGAHHRPLLESHGLASGRCVWASGDLADYGHQRDGTGALAEVGGCYDFIPGGLRAGVGIGKSHVDQDLAFSGESALNGEYVLSELDYQASGTPWLASLTGLYGRWDSDVHRGYLNAGSIDHSSGNPDVEAWSLRARLDWRNAFKAGNAHFTPRAAFTYTAVHVDAYTETGGGFPAAFGARTLHAQELRYGVDGELPLSHATWVRGEVEGVHRFDDHGPSVSGQVLGLFAFSLPGTGVQSDWARAGAGLEHRFTPALDVMASVQGSSAGPDPSVSGGVSLQYAF